jgi:hypothetical protein
MNATHLVIAMVVGVLSGLHVSTWGMFKDSPHEGFTWPKYFRSPIVGAIMAVIAYVIARPDLGNVPTMVVFFGSVYVLERGAIEFWKTFLRSEDQSKYFIPMQFAVFGNVVHSKSRRLVVGAIIAAAVIFIFLGVHWTLGGSTTLSIPVVLAVGSISGWISAFLGAWKDAPVEGFQPLKFVRSPLWAAFYALLLASFTTSILAVIMAGLGFTIATLETYKTFFFPSKPRGKFAGKPLHFPDMLERRKPFAVLYAAIWIAVIAGFVTAFASPYRGLVDLF